MMFQPVSSQVRFPQLEEGVLRFWKEHRIFEKTLDRPDAPLYSFYEGPPYANASPGIHHALARAFKDIILRFWSMRGYRVPRRAGWDTHGLPAEIEVEKQLGFTSKRQIEEYGVAEFNARCKENVLAYVDEWNRFTERLGYWLDLDDAYLTLTNEYIESCWWVLKQLWNNDLIYQGYKVTPHCPRCVTSLADHEVAQGYKDDTPDPSVWVRFRLSPEAREALYSLRPSLRDGDAPVAFLAWTTTPWTLPGNVALALAPDADYAVVETQGEQLILAANLLDASLTAPYHVLDYVTGAELRSLTYEPLFPFEPARAQALVPIDPRSFKVAGTPHLGQNRHRIVTADWVSLEEGTGIVHIAPAYGEIDLQVGLAEDLPVLHSVDLRGLVMAGLPGEGLFAKDADPLITADLRQRGLLCREATIVHTYPFCWRCDTPLLYYAKTSWYIRTTAVKDQLLQGNQRINWYPEHIQRGRFGNWLENNIDWAISRERYWGIPLPIWRCEGVDHHHACVGSIDELRRQPSVVLPDGAFDLHRPYADGVTFACADCGETMRRIPEIADVWFDSGAMPYAQWHYPFKNRDIFKAGFPADFICEAVDQTRGWFYTLHALSTLLHHANPEAVPEGLSYRNVLCLELVLDAKGEKMSKSKGNTVSPWEVMNAHGADALRWYLFTATPPWMPRRFSIDLVAEGLRRYLLTLWNTYVFFVTYARLQGFDPTIAPDPNRRSEMDRWVLARLHETVAKVTEALEAYNPTDAGRALLSLVEDVSNWYLRRSRRRFSRGEDEADRRSAFDTLYTVLRTVASLTAPFTPFVAEVMYQNLVRSVDASAPESVHLASWPTAQADLVDEALLEEMALVEHVVTMGRAARAKANVKVRQPLAQLLVKARTDAEGAVLRRLAPVILDELNVKDLALIADEAALVEYTVRLNMALVGPKYGTQTSDMVAVLASFLQARIAAQVRRGEAVELAGFHLLPEEFLLTSKPKAGFSLVSEGDLTVALTTEVTPELAEEGLAREIVHRLQNLRRDAALALDDRIIAYVQGDTAVQEVVLRHGETLRQETLANEVRLSTPPAGAVQDSANVDGHAIELGVLRVP